MARKVPRTRNAQTWTESQFESAIRSALRQKFRYWKPATEAMMAHSRPYQGTNKRRKIEVQCQDCLEWFPPSVIQKDHIVPAGSLKDESTGRMTQESLWGFLCRLTEEDVKLYQPLCKPCHNIKTQEERKNAKDKNTSNNS